MAPAAHARLHRLQHVAASGTTLAVVVPEWGANVIGFSFHPKELRWPVPFLEPADIAGIAAKPTSYGMPVLAPTPGRVGRERAGIFRYRGVEYRLAHPQHGFLRHLSWRVVEERQPALRCALAVRPAEALGSFPFELDVEQRIEVTERRLDAWLVFRNTGGRVQPLSVGWHPYLHRQPACRVLIPASRLWQLDLLETPTPTGALVPVEGASDFRAGRLLGPEDAWDATFTDLATEDGVARCFVEDEPLLVGRDDRRVAAVVRRTVEVSPRDDGASCGLRHIQLYTPPGRPAIAVEPFSSPPNALNLMADGIDADVRELAPGEEAAFHMGLTISLTLAG